MRRVAAVLLLFTLILPPMALGAGDTPLVGYSPRASQAEREWEAKFRAIPDPANLREYMRRLSARPHHVGSPYDKDNAEWILARFKELGLDAHIETFDVLFPTPKIRVLEMVEPTKFTAKLEEPAIAIDPTSNQKSEQLPTYNAYSIDGDVTAPLVFVNYGLPEDYEKLDRLGISVKGAIVIAKYYQSWRGVKPKVAAEHGAIGCLIYSEPQDDGYTRDDVFPEGPMRNPDGVQRGSVMDFASSSPGDPLTPGYVASATAKRLTVKEAKSITKIPVLPISYGDAQPLLAALKGPMAPDEWRGSFAHSLSRGPGTGESSFEGGIQLGPQAGQRRHRENSRQRCTRRMDHPRQSSRRMGERRGRSGLWPGSSAGRSARHGTPAQARLEAAPHHHLCRLGRRRAHAARLHRMGGGARRRTAPARRRLHQHRRQRPRRFSLWAARTRWNNSSTASRATSKIPRRR